MKSDELVCWSCGSSLAGVPMPLSRISECLSCRRKLHVCLMCEFYDASVSQACREPIAEEVTDKQGANFCEFFRPRCDAFSERDNSLDQSVPPGLGALFGDIDEAPPTNESNESEQQTTEQGLGDLFGGKN